MVFFVLFLRVAETFGKDGVVRRVLQKIGLLFLGRERRRGSLIYLRFSDLFPHVRRHSSSCDARGRLVRAQHSRPNWEHSAILSIFGVFSSLFYAFLSLCRFSGPDAPVNFPVFLSFPDFSPRAAPFDSSGVARSCRAVVAALKFATKRGFPPSSAFFQLSPHPTQPFFSALARLSPRPTQPSPNSALFFLKFPQLSPVFPQLSPRQTRLLPYSALVFLNSAPFLLNSALFFLNSALSFLSQFRSLPTQPFPYSALSQLSPFPTQPFANSALSNSARVPL